ncbi:MAG: adenosylcobinamide-phosphate synthase CbiB [Coriobacteriia bacterium]|nr:adenosylcobinamide-phosphate synthase CbiB [Coriobacteriia bacterium]
MNPLSLQITTRLAVIALAMVLDFIIGDPQNPLHPIRLIGLCIAFGIRLHKNSGDKTPAGQFLAGMLLSLLIIAASFGLVLLACRLLYGLNLWAGLVAEAVICYFLIAAKSLKTESMKVYHALVAGDIEQARHWLSYIVGRDTAELDSTAVAQAAVETVAENLSDGVIAPLLFIMIGGAPLGLAYKAINTLDSMIGYRNDDFMYFGRFAARLDDVVNFIPARLAGLLMVVGARFIGASSKDALRIFRRDRNNHLSPNSAQTEAACAGALGLQLGGDHYYHGELVSKPTIGDALAIAQPEHIAAANRLMYAATILMGLLMLIAMSSLVLISEALASGAAG